MRRVVGAYASSGWITLLAFLLSSLAPSPDTWPSNSILADELTGEELSEEEIRQIKTAERFSAILEKNPRRGTALDRVYGHHVEFGSLDTFLKALSERAEAEDKSGSVWMLLGLFESHRGHDGDAVDAFTKAEKLRPDDALASYYLGQSQLRVGQSEEAVASFERALNRNPQRTDLLEIFQQLGRVHQRAQRTEEALKVWQRLEALFPDDPRVLEQIAVTLAEEGQPALALPRYERLAELVRDDYRRVVFQVAAAELRIKSGSREQGISSLEAVLANLNPESWLYRDVRRRIEDVFLRSGDQDSLVRYYRKWLDSHPEDVEGMARLARFLASSARIPEATEWMEKALKLAPSRTELRKAFIDQLVNDQRYPEAIRQYELLVASAPGNQDFLRDWGKLVLRDKERPEDERRKEAVRIWNQILQSRPDDALTVAQVADLYRQNNMLQEAEALYRRAVELAPGDPQYREYLGEFLHIQKRPEEALSVWSGIAEGSHRNAINLTRLAEVYNSFGFSDRAIVEISDAVKLDPKDFSLQIRAAEYHSRAGKFDEALQFVATAESLSASEDERDTVIQQRIDVLQASQQLDEEAERLTLQIRDNADATLQDWYLLARYLEAGRRWPDATEAIDNALKLDPKSIPALTVAARIAETSGDYGRAADTNRKLAEIDRRSRGDHLMNVSRLEAQLGRADEALQAAQDLIVSAPGNTDNYEFYAQMCFRLGKAEDGLEALRKAVRINPNEPHLIMALGAALAEQLRTDEAIEVYWRAFDKSEEVEDKVGLTMKLAPLYQQVNKFDQLVDRFERDRREEDKRREMTICLAQAWHTTGDFGTARQELESLLSEDTRDTNLLNQLAKLCQDGADLEAAIGYQRQLVAIAPGHETEFPLAGMLMANGQMDEAREIFVKLTQREEDPVRQMKSLDSLLTQGNFEAVISVTEPLLSQQRDDWELLYREGVAWAELGKVEEATNRFERILSLTHPYDSLARSAEAKLKQAQAKAKSDNLRGITTAVPQRQSPLSMQSMSSQAQRAVGLIADNSYSGSSTPRPVWVPEAYGVARMAAFGWLLRFEDEAAEEKANSKALEVSAAEKAARNEASESQPPKNASQMDAGKQNIQSIAARVAAMAAVEDASREALLDWLYVARLRNDNKAVFNLARRLGRTGGKEEQQFFLTSLNLRDVDVNATSRSSSGQVASQKTPLSEVDLQLMRDCYKALDSGAQQVDPSQLYGSNVAYGSNGQVYVLVGNSYMPLAGVFRGEAGFLSILISELRLAGKTDEAEALVNGQIQNAQTAAELASAMALLLSEERFDDIPEKFKQWHEAAKQQIAEAPVTAPARGSSRVSTNVASATVLPAVLNTVCQWMGRLGEQEEHVQILEILDACLDVATAEAQHRQLVAASQTQRRTTIATSSPPGRLNLYYGTETIQANLTFPPANTYQNRSAITVLRQAHEVFQRNDMGTDLVDHLRQRLVATQQHRKDSRVDNDVHAKLYLASALWWIEEQDEAVDLRAQVSASLPDDLSMRFEMASMHESRGDFEDAMEIVDSITPRDQQVLQQRELLALQLAERLGDLDRTRSAAERLFGLRLNSQTQLGLVERMRRLGLHEMADAVLARVERTSSNQTSSLASLMMLYQGQGKTDQARQLAHMLLRRTKSPVSMAANSSRNPLRYRSSDDGLRTQALQLLNRSGELKSLIEQLETQLERSPDSPRLYEQLIEFYGVSGQREKVGEVLTNAVGLRPDSAILRMQLAKHLEQTGKQSEACDQYLEVLKLRPDWLTDDLYQVRRVFETAQRKLDLVKAISQINLKSIRQPYYIVDLASDLLNDDQNTELAVTLMEKVFEAMPSYRRNLISNLNNEKAWKNERVYEFAKKSALPTSLEVKSNAWAGIDDIYSYSGNGEVGAMFHRMLDGISGTDKLPDFEASIRRVAEEQPEWFGGQAMLALIEMKTNRKQDARQRLEKLVANEIAMKSIPVDSCWIIGQELDRFQETRATALTLFEKAMTTQTQNTNQLQYSPVAKLISAYADAGRADEARNILIRQLKSTSFDNYDEQYAAYQSVQNNSWAAKTLLDMKYPIDAVRIYRQMLDDPTRLQTASTWNGNRIDYYTNEAQAGMTKALESLDGSNMADAIRQLLTVPDSVKPGSAALDLMLTIPEIPRLSSATMSSPMVGLLVSLGDDAALARSIDARLMELRQQHPDDISVRVALCAWRLRMENPSVADDIRELSVWVSDHPLELIPEGRRANSRQRREAALAIPLWLIARECFSRDDLNESGQILATCALQAAERQVGMQQQSAILFDWGKVLLEAGHKDRAEARWNQLLQISTQRPQRAKKKAEPETGAWRPASPPDKQGESKVALTPLPGSLQFPREGAVDHFGDAKYRHTSLGQLPKGVQDDEKQGSDVPTELIPPLTLSQFRMSMIIARAAADNGMAQLSREAVREALRGGIPVSDPVAGLQSGNIAMRSTVRSSSTSTAGDPIETEVVNSLRDVIELWQGEEYSAEETCDVLQNLVLPPNRPNEIRLYADTTHLRSGRSSSLADSLIKWAKRANRMTDLQQRVAARESFAEASIPALVMLTVIAVEQGDTVAGVEQLGRLSTTVQSGVPPAMLHLACHAALKAFDHKELKAAAFPILHQTLQQETQAAVADQNRVVEISGRLADMVNEHLVASGDAASVREYFDSVMVGRQSYYSRYSGDYGLYMQWNDLGTVATQTAKLNLHSLALDFMGRACDFDVPRYSRPNMALPLATVCRHLRTLPPVERYATWSQWTLPQEGRNEVRALTAVASMETAPTIFLQANPRPGGAHDSAVLSNLTELVDAAVDAGKLNELKVAVETLHNKKVANSDFLWALIMVAEGDVGSGRASLESLLATMPDRLESESGRSRPTADSDYVVFREYLQSPHFSSLAASHVTDLRKILQNAGQRAWLSRLPFDFAARSGNSMPDHEVTAKRGADFLHWAPAYSRVSERPAWWTRYDDQLVHVGGPGVDALYLKYPLTGDFRFTVECLENPWAECDAGYGGIVVNAQVRGSRTSIASVSGHETINRPAALKRGQPSWNRVTLECNDGRLRYLLNDYLVYEEELSGTSPWLMLVSDQTRVSAFRNPAIEGFPVIPESVQLFANDRMDGWECSMFSESQPRKRIMAEKPESENDSVAYYQRDEPSEFDWSVKDGTLTGLARQAFGNSDQSWLNYHRPLFDNEVFRYEFFYIPGQSVAHPSLGRIAFLLQPEGVVTHWISQPGWDDSYNGVPLNNAVEEAEYRRSNGPLPLKSDDWNHVELTRRDGLAIVRVNGTTVFERPLASPDDSRFGLFRYRNQASRVRNAHMTGNWPQKLSPDIAQGLAVTTHAASSQELLDLDTYTGGSFTATAVNDVVRNARGMDDVQAFDYLMAWVLPSQNHHGIRLYYATEANSQLRASTDPVERFSNVLCPAIELVKTAARINRIESLDSFLQQYETNDPVQLRNTNALKALVAMETSDNKAASEALTAAYETLLNGLPQSLAAQDRAAEFIVAWRAGQASDHWLAGLDLARLLRDAERDQNRRSGNDQFHKDVHSLWGTIDYAARLIPADNNDAATKADQWKAVPYYKPDMLWKGFRPSVWVLEKGALQHVASETWSQLFFQSPLRGKFEIVAERSTHGHKEIAIAYGMHAAEPRYDQKAVRVTTVMHGSKDTAKELNLPAWDQQADFRIQIDGNTVTTWTNGVKIHEEVFASPPDPWLVIQAAQPTDYCKVNDLRILGNPEIPSEINLIEMAGWSGWRADVYGERFAQQADENAPWQHVGDEIVGQLRKGMSAEFLESLLMYQRPILEDGVIEFETYYQPDEFEVHPTIGRQAFILRHDGVRLHRLTNAQYETSGLFSGNEQIFDGALTEVPLKAKDWNKVRLALTGDQLKITVNDVDVLTQTIETRAPERHFGLFRYSDRNRCRVRNLVYRGEWPKDLPSLQEQQLANPESGGPFVLANAESTLDINTDESSDEFSIEKLKSNGFATLGPAEKMSLVDTGLSITLTDSKGYATWPGLIRRKAVDGDFEVTVDYSNLSMKPVKSGWGLVFGLDLALNDPQKTRVECNVSLNSKSELTYKTQAMHLTPEGKNKAFDHLLHSGAADSGRLRIIRRGGQVHCLAAAAGTDQFRLLSSYAVGAAPISSIAIHNKCSDDVGQSQVTVERIQIRQPGSMKALR